MSANQKNLLIAGGGDADIPLIRAAKRSDYRAIISDNRPSAAVGWFKT